ncbi:hypothetical protein EDB92DRAFT_1026486 [Lactarius akahatsu]|uniref:Uncharacterized protein n=1 Tax=Lactarius akahatsu TaxID=416441 RepID=A0AAD4QC11_9AGAM|nr:hypothetical protein EDB92DRAFT_1026486 [Lactarius akahatsu]
MLYGVLMVQTYVYGYNFPDDGTPLKLLVYAVFLIETLQTALTGADLYYWFVSGFGNLAHLTSPYATPFDAPIIGAIVSLIVQFFFVYRIWVLSGRTSWLLCLVICLVGQFPYQYLVHNTSLPFRSLSSTQLPLLVGVSMYTYSRSSPVVGY